MSKPPHPGPRPQSEPDWPPAAEKGKRFPTAGWICFGLGLLTLALYLPVLHHNFVDYDDQQYVTDNPRVQTGLSWSGLVWAFGFYAGNWFPLTWLTHMLDCQLYGAWSGGHHLTNVLLHTASTLLLFAALNRMTNAPWRSAAVAALFAWHPLHVESVAWVAERKDVLCAFFWMLTMLAYTKYVTSGVCRMPGYEAAPTACSSRITHHASLFYSLALISYICALMSKPMAVTLPFVLLLLDYWPLKRFTIYDLRFTIWQLFREKIPFLIVAAGACALTLHAQQIAIVSTAGLPVYQRLLHVPMAYWHYLTALLVPRHLAVYYPYQIQPSVLNIACAMFVLGLLTVLVILNWRRRPWLLAGWLWYLGTLVPVIGLVQVGDQAWADRYTYLPSIGVFVMLVWLAGEFVKSRLLLQIASVLMAIALMTATRMQLGYWRDTRTLFEHANAITSKNYMAITMLGSLLAKEHHYDEAMEYYRKALRIQPVFPEAHFFMGAVYDEQGNLDAALAEYQQALWFKPTQEQTHIFMGIALAKQGKYDEAMAHYRAALKLNPDSAAAENNLARLLHTQGRMDEAIAHYHAALEIDPKLALAHNNLGILLIQQNQLAEGTVQLREAMRLNPTNAETVLNLASALNQQQQWAEAAELFAKIVSGELRDPKAHYQYAVALAHLKRTREAMSQYAGALLLQPDFPDALDGLAWIASTDAHAEFRDGGEAVTMAQRACELTGRQDPAKLKTLAAAYAETGRFAEASATLQSAMGLATQANRPELVEECKRMQEKFNRSEPWRES